MTRARFAAAAVTFSLGIAPFGVRRAVAKESVMPANPTIAQVSATMSHAAEMTVYHVDSYLATRTPIPPERLETYHDVQVHSTKDRATIEKAYAEFHAAQPSPSAEPREYRWKLVMADASGTRIAEIYVAAFAREGAVGGTPVAFANDGLATWLRATYAPAEDRLRTP